MTIQDHLPDAGVSLESPVASPLESAVSVVICAYTMKRIADIEASVAALGPQLGPDDEVLLVVDHNADLLAHLGLQAGARVRVLANAHAQGLSGARNTGVEAARGGIIVFLDDDAVPSTDLLARVRDVMGDATVMGMGGAPVPRWPAGGRPRWFPPEVDWIIGCAYEGLPKSTASVRNPIGAVMAFRAEAFRAVGGFEEGIGRIGTVPLGCEETQFSIRVRQQLPGAEILYVPEATVLHRVTRERLTWRYLLRRSYAEGVSKATIGRTVGAGSALSSEGTYVTKTLPRAVVRELRRTTSEPAAAGAVLAIGASVVMAGVGYVTGSLRRGQAPVSVEGEAEASRGTVGAGSLDVVICTKGRPESAARAVESVLEARWSPERGRRPLVYLVDNGPADGPDADSLRSIAAASDRVVYVNEPRAGASRARNAGLASTDADIVAFTDDDVIVDEGWLESLADGFDSPEVAAVTGLVLPLRLETDAQQLFEAFGGFSKGFDDKRFDSRTSGQGPLYPFNAGSFGSGNNVAFRRSWLADLGGYDVALGPGTPTLAGEDLALFVQLIRGGRTLVYSPSALVRHDHRETMDDLAEQVFGYGRGLSAMLTAVVCERPRELFAILRRVPDGLAFMFSPRSTKNNKRGESFPRRLVLAELRGLVGGPLSYLVEHARTRGEGPR